MDDRQIQPTDDTEKSPCEVVGRGVGGGVTQRVLLVMGRASSAASYFEENLGTRRHRTIFVGDKDN